MHLNKISLNKTKWILTIEFQFNVADNGRQYLPQMTLTLGKHSNLLILITLVIPVSLNF